MELHTYLAASQCIDCDEPNIQQKARQLAEGHTEDAAIAKACVSSL